MNRLCVLLPAYNEEVAIGRLVEEINQLRLPKIEISCVVVDDGSKDKTASVAARAGAKVLKHPVNQGVGAAFATGLRWALSQQFDFLLHMDSDGQVFPSEIPLVAGPVLDGKADLCLGSRFLTKTPRALASWKGLSLRLLAKMVGVATGYPLTDISCGFRCMNRRVMEGITPTFHRDYIGDTLLQALALRITIAQVPVTVTYDTAVVRQRLSSNALRYISRFMFYLMVGFLQFYGRRWKKSPETPVR